MTLTKDHYIQLKDGAFDGTTKDDLDHLFKSLAADPRHDHIVLHFHGGLVGATEEMQHAERLAQLYQDINAYQIFFLWETAVSDVIQQEGGLLSFIEAQLKQIGQEDIFQQVFMRVFFPFTTGKITGLPFEEVFSLSKEQNPPAPAAILNELLSPKDNLEPFADVPSVLSAGEKLQDEDKKRFRDILVSDQNLQNTVQKIVSEYRLTKQAKSTSPQQSVKGTDSLATPSTLISPSILEQMDQQASKVTAHAAIGPSSPFDFFSGKVSEVFSHVRDRFAQQTDHGLQSTVVEEILRTFYLSNVGKNIWDHIKQETVDSFSPSDRGAAVFLRNLRDYCQAGHHPRITLVGHSAGTIYVSQLLQRADKILPPEVKFDVVLLAPACTFKLFTDTLDACKNRIASIRIFGLHDEREKTDMLVSGIYTRSLLYLVSGVFEEVADTPLLGMERFFITAALFNKWPEIARTRDYLQPSPHSKVWSHADDGEGLSSDAKKHGDLYDEEITLTSLGDILRHGLL